MSRVPDPNVMVWGERADTVRPDSSTVPHTGLGRVQAKTRPLEGVHFETAAKLVHSVWRGKDVRIIKESHCTLVGAEVSLQVAECGNSAGISGSVCSLLSASHLVASCPAFVGRHAGARLLHAAPCSTSLVHVSSCMRTVRCLLLRIAGRCWTQFP